MSDRSEEWHAARREGIGGSDWHHVLGYKYGCPRQLWYRKRNTDPDFPREETGPMKRGHKLESMVVAEFCEATGRKTRKIQPQAEHLRKPSFPRWLIGHEDRAIVANNDGLGPGILECKTCNPWVFQALKREGTPEYWIAQTQQYMWLRGWKWGVIAALNPVDWELYLCDVRSDPALIDAMRTAGDRFWRQVENGPAPDRLMPNDPRCRKCPYMLACQGEAIYAETGVDPGEVEKIDDHELKRLIKERDEVYAIASESKSILDGVNSRIKGHLGEPKRVSVSGRRIYYTKVVSHRIDATRLRKDLPDVAAKYTKPSATTRLVVY